MCGAQEHERQVVGVWLLVDDKLIDGQRGVELLCVFQRLSAGQGGGHGARIVRVFFDQFLELKRGLRRVGIERGQSCQARLMPFAENCLFE